MGQELAKIEFTDEETKLIKDSIMPGATDAELRLFEAQCKSWGLSPFKKQIYAVKVTKKDPKSPYDKPRYYEVYDTWVGIEGIRSKSSDTGEYLGTTIPLFCGKDGVWTEAWLKSEYPMACKIGIKRKGFDEPLYRVRLWSECVKTDRHGQPTGQWPVRPCNMLEKCTEAACHRAAFPIETGGMYIEEEIDRGENIPVVVTENEATPTVTPKSAAVDVKLSVAVAKSEEVVNTTFADEKKPAVTDVDALKVMRNHMADELKLRGATGTKAIGDVLGGTYVAKKDWTLEHCKQIEQWAHENPVKQEKTEEEQHAELDKVAPRPVVHLDDPNTSIHEQFVSVGGDLAIFHSVCELPANKYQSLADGFSEVGPMELRKLNRYIGAIRSTEEE